MSNLDGLSNFHEWSLEDVVIPDHPCPPARCSLEEWYAEAETLDYLGLKPLWMRYRKAWDERDPQDPNAGADIVTTLGRVGYSFDKLAAVFECDVEAIVRPLAANDDGVERLLAVERLFRADPTKPITYYARETNETQGYVSNLLSKRLGHVFPRVKQLAQGGGVKYGPEVYEQIRHYREVQGLSYREIEKLTMIQRAVVAKICIRKGFTKAQPEELVAA